MKTVFITGASSGIGKETAKLFLARGWNVIATMRNPQTEQELTQFTNALILQCDVTDPKSIKAAVEKGVSTFHKIDVLINNAGYYLFGPLESATEKQIKRQIDTNLVGMIQVTKEVIPHFREQREGIIINLSSIAGIISIPLQSLYHATKWGVEGFSESLQYELRPFHIRVKLIEPGVIKTDFLGRSMTLLQNKQTEYDSYTKKVLNNIYKNGANGSDPNGVAQTIYKAASDNSRKMRYLTGRLKSLVYMRTLLPQRAFQFFMGMAMER